MPSVAPTKLPTMMSTWTDGSDGPLSEALSASLIVSPTESGHENYITRRAVAGTTTPPAGCRAGEQVCGRHLVL